MRYKSIHEITDFNNINRGKWVKEVAESIPSGSNVLDLGAGECQYKPLFAHCNYKAQDFAEYKGTTKGILQGEWNYGELDYVCDITNVPANDKSFDVILCTEVFEHVPEPIKVVKEIARLLKSGGKLFLTAPLGCGMHQRPYHYYGGYTPHFYEKFLPEAGLEILEIKANGGFFKHFLQEANRAGGIIMSKKQYSRINPSRYIVRWIFQNFIPIFCDKLDNEIFVEEFTVGFFIKAIKL